jgi:hypothetical protein
MPRIKAALSIRPRTCKARLKQQRDPNISDESSSYLSSGGFDTPSDSMGSDNDGSDLQPAPLTVTPNE